MKVSLKLSGCCATVMYLILMAYFAIVSERLHLRNNESHLFRDCAPLTPLSVPREATQRQKFGGTPLPGLVLLRVRSCERQMTKINMISGMATGNGRLIKNEQCATSMILPSEHQN